MSVIRLTGIKFSPDDAMHETNPSIWRYQRLLQDSESKYDCYGAGHASTSISAAVALQRARDLKERKLPGRGRHRRRLVYRGLAYEGLNNATISTVSFLVDIE
jgi:deoxyxylulose-5-phosphate synthase